MRKLTFDADKTIKGKFKPSPSAERQFLRAVKKVAKVSGHLVESHVDGVKIKYPEKMLKALKEYSELIGPWAQRQSLKLLQQVQKSNKRAYTNKSKAIGVALEHQVAEEDVGAVAYALMNEQVALIKSIPIEAGERAQEIAFNAVLEGRRATPDQSVIDQLEKELGMSTDVATNRATLIARTETARATASINQARAMKIGSGQYRWHNSSDGAVRESHRVYKGRAMQGRIFSWDNPPTLSDGMTGHPGTFPNCRCVASNTTLTSAPFIQKIFRRKDIGNVVSLSFDDGSAFTGTPNHPILSMNGFRPLNSFEIGHDVIGEVNQSLCGINEHVKSFDITFEQIFDTCRMLPIWIHATTVGGDFHGDITNQEVNIISPNCGLICEINGSVFEKMGKLGFTDSDKVLVSRFLSGFSCSLEELNISTHGVVGALDLLLPFLRAHFTPLEAFCVALAPHINAGLNETFPNDNPADSKTFSNLIFAYALLVKGFDAIDIQLNRYSKGPHPFTDHGVYASSSEFFTNEIGIEFNNLRNLNQRFSTTKKLRRVIDKSISNSTGHVFNLQTVTGYYCASNVYTQNCFAEPIFEDE